MKHLYLKLSYLFVCLCGIINAQMVSTLAGSTTKGSADGTGTAASFSYPFGVAEDSNKNLYIADTYNNEIRKIVISTGVVTTIAGSTTSGSINGIGTKASFSIPCGITIDASGNLYVADFKNNEIRKIVISTGLVSTLAGSTTSGSVNGVGTAAGFYNPTGVVADGKGNLFVADRGNNEIRKIVISTGLVSTLAGSTASGSANGIGTAASFYDPNGVAIDGSGNLYVADQLNSKIRQIVISTGAVSTLAGSGSQGAVDGTGTAASLNEPTGVATDGLGNLYVADGFNNEIRQIVISTGAVTTLAGSTTQGSADGIGTAASFLQPYGVATDGLGNLYVADEGNNEIRLIKLITTGINELPASTSILIYPNPVNNTLNIESRNSELEIRNIVIRNVLGEKMYSIIADSYQSIANSQMKIDISSLPVGLYFISMENSNGEMVTEKFMKQ